MIGFSSMMFNFFQLRVIVELDLMLSQLVVVFFVLIAIAWRSK